MKRLHSRKRVTPANKLVDHEYFSTDLTTDRATPADFGHNMHADDSHNDATYVAMNLPYLTERQLTSIDFTIPND